MVLPIGGWQRLFPVGKLDIAVFEIPVIFPKEMNRGVCSGGILPW